MSTKLSDPNLCISCSPKGLKNPTSVKKLIPKVRLSNISMSNILNTKDLEIKLDIIDKIYKCKSLEKKKQYLEKWPNIQVTQRLSYPLDQIKPGTFFLGDADNSLIHGYGLVIYNTQRFYEGYFYNNLKHGPGFEKLQFGVYVGNFINNKPEGKGLFIWNNNNIYQGDFAMGIKHGFGKYVTKKLTYIGQWKQNIPYGKGSIITKDSKYDGNIVSGCKHGSGVEEFVNGDTYNGTFINGKFQGLGTYCWFESGSVYKGMFKNGFKHGEGNWSNSIGDRYEGMYQNNRKCGKGIFKYSNGSVYSGNFSNDLRHGFGEMIWNNGQKYSGNWEFGEQGNKIQLQSKTNPINRSQLKRCKTQLDDNLSNVVTKHSNIDGLKRFSTLKTQPTIQLSSQKLLKEHSKKFLNRHSAMTCPNKKALKIQFINKEKNCLCRSQSKRLVYDANHNCSSRRICSVLEATSKQKASRSNSTIKLNRLDIKYKKRYCNNEQQY